MSFEPLKLKKELNVEISSPGNPQFYKCFLELYPKPTRDWSEIFEIECSKLDELRFEFRGSTLVLSFLNKTEFQNKIETLLRKIDDTNREYGYYLDLKQGVNFESDDFAEILSNTIDHHRKTNQ
ncbi:MAG: hypothetical protein P9L92_13500 [Candidatus Electryonea clarkiae]|nr:hypothetical protein [Candidatus Electryonea clarkiae]MDP8288917.1 hypothetical protein [Candidatus Electryonea clarkiae]